MISGVLVIEAGRFIRTAHRDADHLEVSVHEGEFKVWGHNKFNLYGMSDGPYVVTHVLGPAAPKGEIASAALPSAKAITSSHGISIPISGLDWRFADGTRARAPDPGLCEVLYYVPEKSGQR